MTNSDQPIPFHVWLRRTRTEQGLTLEELSYRLRDQRKGPALSLLAKIEQGKRYPKEDALAAVANALGHDPETIPEYRLARMRRLLDDREVGLERATRNLEAIERALARSKSSLDDED